MNEITTLASETTIPGALTGGVIIVALPYGLYKLGVKNDWWDGF